MTADRLEHGLPLLCMAKLRDRGPLSSRATIMPRSPDCHARQHRFRYNPCSNCSVLEQRFWRGQRGGGLCKISRAGAESAHAQGTLRAKQGRMKTKNANWDGAGKPPGGVEAGPDGTQAREGGGGIQA